MRRGYLRPFRSRVAFRFISEMALIGSLEKGEIPKFLRFSVRVIEFKSRRFLRTQSSFPERSYIRFISFGCLRNFSAERIDPRRILKSFRIHRLIISIYSDLFILTSRYADRYMRQKDRTGCGTARSEIFRELESFSRRFNGI